MFSLSAIVLISVKSSLFLALMIALNMLSILCRLLWIGMMLILSILTISTLVDILFKFSIGTVLYMATSNRHFDWFNCDVELTLRLAGETRSINTFFSFYSAYSLSALQQYVNISYLLPKRFCDAKLSFRRIGPVLLPRDYHCRRFYMRSFDAIKQMAIRNIIYTLTIDKLIYEFQVDKTL